MSSKHGRIPSPRRGRFAVLTFALLLVGACGGEDASVETTLDEGEAAPGSPESAAQAPAPEAAEPQYETVADVFPEGDGRILVLNTCSSCHAVACAAIGQRSEARWESLQVAHREHIPSLTDEDLETIFTYLQENFGADDPEPEIPQAFLSQGCTPF